MLSQNIYGWRPGCDTALRCWSVVALLACVNAWLNNVAAGDDLRLTLQSGIAIKVLVGLFGSDRFRLAVSADGSTFFDGLGVGNTTGIVDQPRLPRIKAYTNYNICAGVCSYAKVGINNPHHRDKGELDAAYNRFVAPAGGSYPFRATLMTRPTPASPRMRGCLVLNGTAGNRGSFGEISATLGSLATAIWLQTMVSLTAGDTVEL